MPRFEVSRWWRFGQGSGAIHLLGFFIEWEPWALRIGCDFLVWSVHLEFEGAFTKEARQKVQEEKDKAKLLGTDEGLTKAILTLFPSMSRKRGKQHSKAER
ncbi:hypothetical protein ES708_09521 [subsurface metagenome]